MLEELDLDLEGPPTVEDMKRAAFFFRNAHWNRRMENSILPEDWP